MAYSVYFKDNQVKDANMAFFVHEFESADECSEIYDDWFLRIPYDLRKITFKAMKKHAISAVLYSKAKLLDLKKFKDARLYIDEWFRKIDEGESGEFRLLTPAQYAAIPGYPNQLQTIALFPDAPKRMPPVRPVAPGAPKKAKKPKGPSRFFKEIGFRYLSEDMEHEFFDMGYHPTTGHLMIDSDRFNELWNLNPRIPKIRGVNTPFHVIKYDPTRQLYTLGASGFITGRKATLGDVAPPPPPRRVRAKKDKAPAAAVPADAAAPAPAPEEDMEVEPEAPAAAAAELKDAEEMDTDAVPTDVKTPGNSADSDSESSDSEEEAAAEAPTPAKRGRAKRATAKKTAKKAGSKPKVSAGAKKAAALVEGVKLAPEEPRKGFTFSLKTKK